LFSPSCRLHIFSVTHNAEIRALTFSYSAIDSRLWLHFTLDLKHNMPRPYGTPLRHLMPISWNAATVSLQLFSPAPPFPLKSLIIYAIYLIKLHTLQVTSLHLDAIFSIRVFVGSKFCPLLIDNFSLTVPSRNASNVTQFSESRKNFSSARCETDANLVGGDTDIRR